MTFKELKFLFLLQCKHQLYIVLDYGICNLSIVPIRSNNSHKSELISQLLYGDCFKLLAEEKDWIKIITLSDEYTGWIDKKQFVDIRKDIAEEISFNINSYSNRLINYIETSVLCHCNINDDIKHHNSNINNNKNKLILW